MKTIITCVLLGTLAFGSVPATAAETNDDPFQKRRAEAVAAHDQNGDGRLDAAEREQMRMAMKTRKPRGGSGSGVPAEFLADYDADRNGDMDEQEWVKARQAETGILKEKYDTNADGTLDDAEISAMLHEVRTVRMRYARDYFAYLLKYDLNKNGEFDGDEYGRAQAAEGEVLKQTYDDNRDGNLGPEEKARIQADIKNGTIVGFYIRFASAAIGGDRRGNAGFNEAAKKLLEFDANGDGLASLDELQAIREARKP